MGRCGSPGGDGEIIWTIGELIDTVTTEPMRLSVYRRMSVYSPAARFLLRLGVRYL